METESPSTPETLNPPALKRSSPPSVIKGRKEGFPEEKLRYSPIRRKNIEQSEGRSTTIQLITLCSAILLLITPNV
ncbi:hypothetical protein CEXT_622541 [Caerostris extrusa]|uniref:Uncharacterized protein n=1 Tax=Caerostris extrusa TaxID=172846 RepID=A0AAV4RCQ3_CAEEX|nr:hypothetical protein CEXT_622541 [Caerostris extrusa]